MMSRNRRNMITLVFLLVASALSFQNCGAKAFKLFGNGEAYEGFTSPPPGADLTPGQNSTVALVCSAAGPIESATIRSDSLTLVTINGSNPSRVGTTLPWNSSSGRYDGAASIGSELTLISFVLNADRSADATVQSGGVNTTIRLLCQ